MKKLPKGTEIICPGCERVLLRLTRDLFSGETMRERDFEPVSIAVKAGDDATCPFCRARYARLKANGGGEVHTKFGWL